MTGGVLGDVVVAVDVGGTTVKCALVGSDGRVHHAERHATRHGADRLTTRILDIAAGLAGTARERGLRPYAVGLVVPGVVDEAAGVAVWAANLDLREVPLASLAAQRLNLPATLGHDVRAGGLAEARLGSGRGYRHVLVVPIGTGIAAAHVVDGRVFSGAHGAAGEIGHIVVRPGGPRCGCGNYGCLETIASAAAVARRYAERTGTPETAERVGALAAAGDEAATGVWAEAVDALADGLLTGIALFDPEIVVIGGGLAEAGEALLAPLRSALKARITFHREPVLQRAALGDEAGCLGAALLAMDASQARA
jgi:glucokinase